MNTKKEFICGIPLVSSSSQEVIEAVGNPYDLTQQVAISEVIICTPRYAVDTDFLSMVLPLSFCFFIIIGYFMGKHKSKKDILQAQDALEEYREDK